MHDDFYQMYLEELEQIRNLEREEEEKLLFRLSQGDMSVRDRLIEGNLKTVLEYAKEYENQGVVMNDLVQEANMALTFAVGGFDGGDFQTYLEDEVRKALESVVAEQKQEAEIEEEMLARVNVLQQVSSMMAKELGREATVDELAEKMKMTPDEIKGIMKIALDAVNVSQAEHLKMDDEE
ncbi:sigma-70 domain-containing protein [Clostridium sp. AM58-1XD]|uniref:sigma-70 domain-containing protein n=1 Tax=Clostridium sp. AM58-1XD TaxID=2292307 RepID=UPI000E495DCE|nr:sigma-70 domain-containing protein [Clostridium sp. AM58-1XD]RGY96950.1 RNA polymerase subunit sigma-70 [Clostridium sp. AM58-1XD]